MNKVILVICDGLGDRPVKELGDKTPLEAANTPNLDRLAKEGITGIMDTFEVGTRPGSDTAHLALLGYDLDAYYRGRGPFEVLGLEMEIKEGDVSFRANVGTVDEDMVIKDRRAGRISDTSPFAAAVHGMELHGVKFLAKPGTGHRIGLIMRGKGLSSEISDSDPHIVDAKVKEVHALDDSKEARFTAKVLNEFLQKAHEKIKDLPINSQRVKEGKPPANVILVRGAGYSMKVPSFQERYHLKACCIAGAGLYKGIGRYVGMDILEAPGATGLPDSDIESKFKTAKAALKDYDFVMVHVKAADSLGEDGNPQGKRGFIEKIDAAAKVLLTVDDAFVIVTADHSTPCVLKNHSGDPVPILMWGDGVRTDAVDGFGERPCARGGLNRIKGHDLMKEVLNLLGVAKLLGD